MSTNGKSTLSGDSNSEKPKGLETGSSPGPIKPIGTPYISSDLSSGDLHSKKDNGEASVSFFGLTKPIRETDVPSGVSIGERISKKSNTPITHTLKTSGFSGVRGKAAVSSGFRGKAIVSANVVEVISFKDVKLGPQEGEVRFRLIHFWEALNVRSKVLIGLEMLLIDQEALKNLMVRGEKSC